MVTNLIDNLLTVLEAVKESAPSEIAGWFEDSLQGYIENGGSLDDSLGLKPEHGQRSFRYQFQQYRRDGFRGALIKGTAWHMKC